MIPDYFANIALLMAVLCGAAAFIFFVLLRKNSPKNLRKEEDAQSPDETRKADRHALTAKQQARRNNAYRLISEGRTVQGTQILEDLGLRREAIQILESDGFIEEACALLMRINRPARAALMFARNRMPVKAAEHYTVAGKIEEAAEQYLVAARKNKSNYMKAAKLFEQIQMHEKAQLAYAALGHAAPEEFFLQDVVSGILAEAARPETSPVAILEALADSLVHLQRHAQAAQVFEALGNYSEAAKYSALCGKLEKCLAMLERATDVAKAAEVKQVLVRYLGLPRAVNSLTQEWPTECKNEVLGILNGREEAKVIEVKFGA